ncbi:hydrolase 1, exosortase A system-associated [Colwelliaceae bacterium 6441]
MNNNVVEKTVSFRCNESQLQGIYHEVDNATHGVIIVVGGPQSRVGSHRMFVDVARGLAKQGITVFRFDYRGAGDSEGELQPFTETVDDINAAVLCFHQAYPKIRSVNLWGLCDAASAIAMYLDKYQGNQITNVFMLNPWVKQTSTEAQAILKYYYWQRLMDKTFWLKLLTGKFNPFKSASDLVEHKKMANTPSQSSFVDKMLSGLQAFQGNVHVFLSENDLTAQEFIALRQQSSSWSQLKIDAEIVINGANHTFASPHWKQQIGSLTFNTIISS